ACARIDFETGRISVSQSRIWKLHLALLEIAERGCSSGDDMLPLLGHYTWAAILRRCLLGVFHGAYRFARAAGSRRWPEVFTECRVAAALIAFAYMGTKLEMDPVVLATGASTGSGDVEGSGFGGFAMTEKAWNPCDVWAAASCMERWRYRPEAAIEARRHALAAAQNHADFRKIMNMEGVARPEGEDEASQSSRILGGHRDTCEKLLDPSVSPSEVEQTTFEDIDPNFLLPLDSWKLKVFGRWQRPEDIMRLEGRALITGVRHRLRRAGASGHVILSLCGNLSLTLALEKGRSSHYVLNQICRESAALRILTGSSVAARRFSSELDSADKGGRAIGGPPSSHGGDCRHAGQLGANGARGLAASALARACCEASTWRGAGGARSLGEVEQRGQPGRDRSSQGAPRPHGDQGGPLERSSGRRVRSSPSSGSSSSSDVGSIGSVSDSGRDPEKTTAYARSARHGGRVRNFLEWANEGSLGGISTRRLDQLAAKHMDTLFFDGMEVGEARVGARETWCRPWVLAVVGVSLLLEDLGFAAALWLAWGGLLRLPPDLVSMAPKTLIGPSRGAAPARALPLNPSDEGARARGPGCRLWSFDGLWFTERFEARLAALPEAPAAAAYQVRRGAASHAAAVDLLPLSAVTERLQRASARSSLRYAEHVRYLAMLKQAPQVVVDWSELIHVLLGCLLLGADVLE
ncbi:unnamed protein product, partial [Prorocentrum cordatum]